MASITFIAGVALIFGLLFDAFESLPYMIAVVSVLAILVAGLLLIASGLNFNHTVLGFAGLCGLLSSWDTFFTGS